MLVDPLAPPHLDLPHVRTALQHLLHQEIVHLAANPTSSLRSADACRERPFSASSETAFQPLMFSSSSSAPECCSSAPSAASASAWFRERSSVLRRAPPSPVSNYSAMLAVRELGRVRERERHLRLHAADEHLVCDFRVPGEVEVLYDVPTCATLMSADSLSTSAVPRYERSRKLAQNRAVLDKHAHALAAEAQALGGPRDDQ
ncbi:hypothetical protein OH77DRAFT_355165 [Trametes cingulata]|nr:hypothetical protein OH77DRAFT_355165 [Trametes cingulata]